MANIRVNRSVLTDVADTVSDYVTYQNGQMRTADLAVKSMLFTGWMGQDAQAFGGKWEAVDSNDSATIQLRESLKSFAAAVEQCEKLYKDAQIDAVNKANWLKYYIW